MRQLDVSELEKLQTERLMNGRKKIKVGNEWRTIPNKPATATNSPYQKDLKKSFATALKKAGITDFHFHDLRHTFASQLVMAGVDLTTVSRLLGHKSLTMTLRYSHLAPNHLTNAVNTLDNVLNGKSTIQKLYNRVATV